MKTILAFIRKVRPPDLPTLGIFAFALASTWSLFNLFNNSAIHPTWLYWIPAALCEIVTAWLTRHIVEAVFQITRSNIKKQDRRFFWIVAIVSTALVTPTFVASVLANHYEFQGEIWLALLFPVAVIGCAIGAQIPRSVERYQSAGDDKSKAELKKVKDILKQAGIANSLALEKVDHERREENERHGIEKKEAEAQLEKTLEMLAESERKLTIPFAEAFSTRRHVSHQVAHNVMERDGWGCYWCGRDLRAEPRHKTHIDHFYPESKGGATNEMNLVVSCQSCNLTKSARLPTEREVRDFKVYLVNNTRMPQKEKVWALHIAGIVDKQRDIASALGVSSSYVSSSLAELPSSPNGGTAELCERLELVGKPQEQVEKEI